MGKDPEQLYTKAERLLKAKQFKKAGKIFNSAGEEFEKILELEAAKRSYVYGAKSYLENDDFSKSLELLRKAAELSIQINQFLEAHKIYQKCIDLATKLDKIRESYENQLLFSTFSYLCYFLIGDYDKGLHVIKRAKKQVDNGYFIENKLIKIVKNFMLITKNHNHSYLKKIENEISEQELLSGELKLIKTALCVARLFLFTKSDIIFNKDIYTTNDVIKLEVKLDISVLIELSKEYFYDFHENDFKITKINVNLTNNFTTHEKPDLPIIINPNKVNIIPFVIKPHFQLENPQIGPISLTCVLDNIFMFNHDTVIFTPNLISPPPSLKTSIKNLRPPLIEKTFPLQIMVENDSEGDALDLNIKVSLPKELKLIRGTKEKKVYSLNSKDNIIWELQLRPLEAGDFEIKIEMVFKDPDGNIIENSENFPIAIKL